MSTKSAPPERLVLVDEHDKVLGYGTWEECHRGEGRLHRAVSVFIFNPRGEVLLQRRSAEKKLWPFFWSNACCTHPRACESYETAAGRRLQEELGVQAGLTKLFSFRYHARNGGCSEHELCTVFAGICDQAPAPDPAEICDWRWLDPARLDLETERPGACYTPWSVIEWSMIRELIGRTRWIGVEAR